MSKDTVIGKEIRASDKRLNSWLLKAEENGLKTKLRFSGRVSQNGTVGQFVVADVSRLKEL